MKFTPLIKRLCISMAVAVGLLVFDYYIGNSRYCYTLLDDSLTFALAERFFPHDDTDDSDVLHIDVSLDKQLAPVLEYNDTIGYIPITDRQKLYDFLSIARTADYRYILMDIRFEQGTDTPIDSALFSLITSMPRLVISTHADDNYTIADSSLLQKAAYADFESTLFSGFTKYEYIQHGQESVPMRMYRELDGGNIAKHGFIYSSHGSLCNNAQSIPLTAPVEYVDTTFVEEIQDDIMIFYEVQYDDTLSEAILSNDSINDNYEDSIPDKDKYRLGIDMLVRKSPEEVTKLLSGKIILIGDYTNDIHTSYVGDIPGPIIQYQAYRTLHNGNHRIKWLITVVLFLVYTAIAYLCMYFNDSHDAGTFAAKHPIAISILSLLGWGSLLYILELIIYIICHSTFIFTIPAFIFSVLGFLTIHITSKSDISK